MNHHHIKKVLEQIKKIPMCKSDIFDDSIIDYIIKNNLVHGMKYQTMSMLSPVYTNLKITSEGEMYLNTHSFSFKKVAMNPYVVGLIIGIIIALFSLFLTNYSELLFPKKSQDNKQTKPTSRVTNDANLDKKQ